MKHKLFLYIFSGFEIVKLLLSGFFPECFLMRHVWLLYSIYFLVALFTLFEVIPTVSLTNKIRIVERVMLGDGTLTNEVFDIHKYRNYSLLCETEDGNAYSSHNGEMLYTKIVEEGMEQGDTTEFSLFLYIIFYSIIGFYIFDLVYQIISGTINMDIPIELLKRKLNYFNIFSSKYTIVENLKYLCSVSWELIKKLFKLIQLIYEQVIG